MTFLDIYTNIIQFYPLGIREDDFMFAQYGGIKQLKELCYSKLEPEPLNSWKNTVESLKKRLPIKAIEIDTPLILPSYRAKLLFEKRMIEDFVYTQQVIIYKSVIGPFYTLYGIDKVSLQGMRNEFGPLVYISPEGIYKESFSVIRETIEDIYHGFEFVPFPLLKTKVDSLFVPFSINRTKCQTSTVFQAMFDPNDISDYNYTGDESYV